jgi:hypothetical protein
MMINERSYFEETRRGAYESDHVNPKRASHQIYPCSFKKGGFNGQANISPRAVAGNSYSLIGI